jgi:LCP family protein required for cell wall assembly
MSVGGSMTSIMPPCARHNAVMQRAPVIAIATVLLLLVVAAGVFMLGGGTSAPPPTPEPSQDPSPTASLPPSTADPSLATELMDRPWTILFVGLDRNEERAQRDEPVNADALMVVHVDESQSRVSLVSIPRDTVNAPLADGSVHQGKINALYGAEGVDRLAEAVEGLTGVRLDGYLALDMDDFTSLVDVVGTIEVAPDEPIVDPIVDLDLEAGTQQIDGDTANGYVRTRVDQDYGRMGRQQEVLVALVERLVREDGVELGDLVDRLDSLETDLPIEDLPTLVEIARRSTDAELRTMVIQPPLITFEGDRGDGRGYILEPDVEAIRDEVRALIGEE